MISKEKAAKSLLLALRGLFVILLVAVTAICSIPAVSKAAGIRTYVVRSASMEPVIRKDSLAFIKEDAMPSEGSVIVFYSETENTSVIHRVISVTRTGYVTKGDANVSEDGETPFSNVKGVCLFSVPVIGIFLKDVPSFIYVSVIYLSSLFILIRLTSDTIYWNKIRKEYGRC